MDRIRWPVSIGLRRNEGGILEMKEGNVDDILAYLDKIDVGKEGIRKISEILLNWLRQKEKEYFLGSFAQNND